MLGRPRLAMFDDRDERTDAELLAATGDGDRTALAALYARHAPWLLVRLSRRCADRSVVDEVVQDTFVEVWRGARRWAGRGEVAAWIWGIGVRRLIDRCAGDARLRSPRAGVRSWRSSAEEQVLLGVETVTWAARWTGSRPSCARWCRRPSWTD